jgi:protocatechuate 3,4-dioxygenase alpha subunit
MIPSPYCTIGPFFPFQFVDGCEDLTQFEGKNACGQHILLTGRISEEGDVPTANAIVEIWQADAKGIFRHSSDPRSSQVDPGFFGWGRARTDRQGWYRFRTVIPGHYAMEDGAARCPHIDVMVLAIGLTRRLVTTAFFQDQSNSADDHVLRCVTDPELRQRLFATRHPALDSNGLPAYRFDLVLRGEKETPFFLD